MNLIDSTYLDALTTTYSHIMNVYHKYKISLPTNQTIRKSPDLLLRKLDCTSIEEIHKIS